jgi:hypothetical protein
MKKRQGHQTRNVSATELAQMGTCERMVWLEHRLGRRRTPEQEAAARRGLAEHARFFDESKRLQNGDAEPARGRCFVATLLLADRAQATPHLATLRDYRDLVMKRSPSGRYLVMSYYRMGPALCRILVRHAWLQDPARAVVVALAKLVAASLDRRRNSHQGMDVGTRNDADTH